MLALVTLDDLTEIALGEQSPSVVKGRFYRDESHPA
jgi:hypothetical protein